VNITLTEYWGGASPELARLLQQGVKEDFFAIYHTGGKDAMRRALSGTVLLAVLLSLRPAAGQVGPRIDVAFLLDATGSMADEIDAVKVRIREMISEIAVGEPPPDVRFGIVAYRDRGDEYVTATYDLTRDIDQIVENLDQIEANGGGDYPESLNQALHAALHELSWDLEAGRSRLVFLIADAPPHLDYPEDYDYREEAQMAQEKGIVVHAIGASGLDEEGERIFTEIAQTTEGSFQWLTYESRYVDQDGEEVVVVVEGRTATYTKGDSTWTVEGGGMMDATRAGGFEKGGVLATAEGVDAPAAEAGAAGPVETSLNLADLITDAVKEAAADAGVDYEGRETALRSASWGELKKTYSGR